MPTTDKEQESRSRRAIELLCEVIKVLEEDVAHEAAEVDHEGGEVKKAYTAEQRKEVRRKKREEYGTKETFAVPGLDSYPLTKDGKPDEERVRAAWSYIHHPDNAAKLGDQAKAAERRIRAFAKKHFPEMELEGGDETKKDENMHKSVGEVYVFPGEKAFPLTKSLRPDAELVQAAWRDVHGIRANHILGEQADVAEHRIRFFAEKHGIALEQ